MAPAYLPPGPVLRPQLQGERGRGPLQPLCVGVASAVRAVASVLDKEGRTLGRARPLSPPEAAGVCRVWCRGRDEDGQLPRHVSPVQQVRVSIEPARPTDILGVTPGRS